jgi:hypothetical protein
VSCEHLRNNAGSISGAGFDQIVGWRNCRSRGTWIFGVASSAARGRLIMS